MPTKATIVTSSVADPLRLIARWGGDPQRLMLSAGVSREFLSEPAPAMPLQAFVRLSQVAASELRRPEFGWHAGEDFDLSNLGPLGHAMLRARNVGTAYQIICESFRCVQSTSELKLDVDGDRATLSYRILDPEIWPREQDAELTMATLRRVMCRAAGEDWRPDVLIFEHNAPEGPQRGRPRARDGVFYGGSRNEMSFPAALLSLPMPDYDPEGYRNLAAQSRRLAHETARLFNTPGLVRQQILSRFGQGEVDQTEIASALGMSRRALRRRLADHGTSYSQVLSDCRQSVARHRLHHTRLSIADIALELGYSDQTAFERAFRKVEGMTPTRFRRSEALLDSVR